MNFHAVSARLALVALLVLATASCAGDDTPLEADAGITLDAAASDAAPVDAAVLDAGPSDATLPDGGPDDAGPDDAGPDDAGPDDAGPDDAGPDDAGPDDAGPDDAGPDDAGPSDGGPPPDAGPCLDGDGDGHEPIRCGGDDCDDTRFDVSPEATEICNAGVDDDCNGAADAADGVCVPCPAGYAGFDGDCADVDECARDTDDCDDDPDACSNTIGTFACACPTGFTGAGRGAAGCVWGDPSLSDLTVGAGAALSPAFAPGTITYALVLPPGTSSTMLVPTVAMPGHATIAVDGTTVASGASATASVIGFGPIVVSIVVTAESGATRSYTIAVTRGNTYVKASNTGAIDIFGQSTALSSDGSTLAVGAPRESSRATGIDGDQANNSATSAGAVYVFRRSGTVWSQEAYIKASNTSANDGFGGSVSLSADGSTLAVGALGEGSSATGIDGNQADNSMGGAGAVYLFHRSGLVWSQTAYVKESNTTATDRFGTVVALSGDGLVLAVGAIGESSNATGVDGNQANESALAAGAVYVFRLSGGAWSQEAYVKASNTNANDRFGASVALSANGSTLAVGAHFESSNATGIDGDGADNSALAAGAVYVFRRGGTTWAQEAYVKASNAGRLDWFGFSIALSDDGSTLAVGARDEDSSATGVGGDETLDTLADSGAVYVFRRSGTVWSQEAYIKSSNAGASDEFGHSISLSGDGSVLAAGAINEASRATGIGGDQTNNSMTTAGAVYVFRRSGTTWSQEAYVKASNTGADDMFGRSVALSSDGLKLAVGAYGETSRATGIDGDQLDNGAPAAGAAYVF